MHVAIETSASLIGVLAAFLVLGRLRRSGRAEDYSLLAALSILAITNLLFSLVPAVTEGPGGRVVVWAGIGGHLAAAALLAVAAFSPATPLGRLPAWSAPALAAALVGLDFAVVALLEPELPRAISSLTPERSGRPDLVGHPAVLAVQIAIAALYTLAAAGFLVRAERRRDAFMTWLAIGTALAALSRVNYFLYPSLYSQWVYTGDLFRLAFYAALLVGALREIAAYWQMVRSAAVLEERRRIARNLHDGLAQEVSYISRTAKLLQEPEAREEASERLAAAAERALQESRQVIAALATPAGEPLEAVIERVADDTAARFGVEVVLDLAPGIALDAARTEALVRIVGEAVANAGRHSGASSVRVVLDRRGGRPRLQVIDRGTGFADEPAPAPGGFGLTSMRERAVAVGAEFRIHTRRGSGTRIEVAF